MGYHVIAPDEEKWQTRPHADGEPARHVAELSDVASMDYVRRAGGASRRDRCTSRLRSSPRASRHQATCLDNKYERQKWMTERLTDAEAANAPDDSEREYDLDNKADRLAWMTQRMNGTEFDDLPAADEAA